MQNRHAGDDRRQHGLDHPILENILITPSFFTHTSHKCLLELTPDTTPIEMEVMGWFAAGHEILWIPIYEVGPEPDGLEIAKAEHAHFGDGRLVRDVSDLYLLPHTAVRSKTEQNQLVSVGW